MPLGALTSLSQEFLLAVDSGGADLRELWFAPNVGKERIGVHRRIRTIVPLDGSTEYLNSGFRLFAIRQIGSKKIVLFRVLLKSHATRQRGDFGEWPMSCASQ